MNTRWITLAVILLVVLGGGAFLLFNNNSATSPTPTVTQTPSTQNPTDSPADITSEDAQVTFTNQGFTPKTVTIKTGTKVVWTNNSGQRSNVSSDPHPIHTNFPELNLGNFNDGETVEYVFEKIGTYGIHDHLNPSFTGTIIVE